jgi:hypothetical protein
MVFSILLLVRSIVDEVNVDRLLTEGLNQNLSPNFKGDAREQGRLADGSIAGRAALWWCDGASTGFGEEWETGELGF